MSSSDDASVFLLKNSPLERLTSDGAVHVGYLNKAKNQEAISRFQGWSGVMEGLCYHRIRCPWQPHAVEAGLVWQLCDSLTF